MVEQDNEVLVLIKPDAIRRGLVGKVFKRFEDKGFKVISVRTCITTHENLEEHYEEHKGKEFYPKLIDFMIGSNFIIAVLFERVNAIRVARALAGAMKDGEYPLGTLRGDLAESTAYNIVHVSDSRCSYLREKEIWFGKERG